MGVLCGSSNTDHFPWKVHKIVVTGANYPIIIISVVYYVSSIIGVNSSVIRNVGPNYPIVIIVGNDYAPIIVSTACANYSRKLILLLHEHRPLTHSS
jgi:hypothetical protein